WRLARGADRVPEASMSIDPLLSSDYHSRAGHSAVGNGSPSLPLPRRSHRRSTSLAALLISTSALTGFALVPSAQAGTPQWLGTVSSDWFAAGNWSPAAVPTAADSSVTIDTTTPNPTVISGATANAPQIFIGAAGSG